MKSRFWTGCAAALGLLVVGGLAFLWFTILAPTRRVQDDIEAVAELHRLESDLYDQDAFTPPLDGVLTPQQVARFSRVQESLSCRLHEDLTLLDDRARRFRELDGGEPGGFRGALNAFEGLGPLLARAKRVQVRALNEEGFSRDEYRWVRTEIYRALGVSGGAIYLEDVAQVFRDGRPLAKPPRDERPVPALNRDVVVPYGAEVDCWVPFLVFGL